MNRFTKGLLTVGAVIGGAKIIKEATKKPPRVPSRPSDGGQVTLPTGETIDFADCTQPVESDAARVWAQSVALPTYLDHRPPAAQRDDDTDYDAAFYGYLHAIADKHIPAHCKPGGQYLDLADQLMAYAACAVFQNMKARGELETDVDCADPLQPWRSLWAAKYYAGGPEGGTGPEGPGGPWIPTFPGGPWEPVPPTGDTNVSGPGGLLPPSLPTEPWPIPPSGGGLPPGTPGGKASLASCGPTRVKTLKSSAETVYYETKDVVFDLFPAPKAGCIYRLSIGVCVTPGSGVNYGVLPLVGDTISGDVPLFDEEGFVDYSKFVLPVAWKRTIIAQLIVFPSPTQGDIIIGETGRHRPVRKGVMDLCKGVPNAWPRPRGGDLFSVGSEAGSMRWWKAVPTAQIEQQSGATRLRVTVPGIPQFLKDGGKIYADSTVSTNIEVKVRAKLVPISVL